jgi:secreted PhoX family phosphatase
MSSTAATSPPFHDGGGNLMTQRPLSRIQAFDADLLGATKMDRLEDVEANCAGVTG